MQTHSTTGVLNANNIPVSLSPHCSEVTQFTVAIHIYRKRNANRIAYRSNKCHSNLSSRAWSFQICAQLKLKLVVCKMHRMCQINHEIIPKMPSRCTVEQYDRLCYDKNRHAEKQQMMADTVLK